MGAKPIRLKAVLQEKHWQTYGTFCREYDRAARLIDSTLIGSYPSRAQFHRWLVGNLKGLPYPDHCRVLEQMFPGLSAAQLFETDDEATLELPPVEDTSSLPTTSHSHGGGEVVAFYPHRSQAPRELWLDLLKNAEREITLMAYASLFINEDNPESIKLLRDRAVAGVRIRIALGDPDTPEIALRGVEEQLYEGLVGRVRMAITYYRPLLGIPNIEFRLHRTTLYNSIFVYDDQMLLNQHAYGVYGYMAPILHLRRSEDGDLFEMYRNSLERVWEVSYPYTPEGPSIGGTTR